MSLLEQVIQSYIPKTPLKLTRLSEHGDAPNLRPESAADLMAYCVRDLRSLQKDIQSHLQGMRQQGGDERLILQLENEADILDGVIERIERASKMAMSGHPMTPDEEHDKWVSQYGESFMVEAKNYHEHLLKQTIDRGGVPDVVVAGFKRGEFSTGDLERIGYGIEHTDPHGPNQVSSYFEYTGPGMVRVVSERKPYFLTANPQGPDEKNRTEPVEWDPT